MIAPATARSRGTYDGTGASALAERWARPLVVAMTRATSTLDVAHELAGDGAPPGTVVIADEQTAGRGRAGKRWRSAPGQGIWLTTIERPHDAATLDVLSLRAGLQAAAALEPFAVDAVGIKWPNDLLVAGRKLAGILIEARWRERHPEWVAIGIGVNVRVPDVPGAGGLAGGVSRLAVLDALLPALRRAADATGPLTSAELTALAARDVARGRRVRAPLAGMVEGIGAAGELLVRAPGGVVHRCRAGSLVFTEEG